MAKTGRPRTGCIVERKRKDGTVSYQLKYLNRAGKVIWRATGAATREEAERTLEIVRGQIASGDHLDPSRLTVGAWLDDWLTLDRENARRKTLARYRQLAAYIQERLGKTKLQDLDSLQIDRFYAWLSTRGRARVRLDADGNAKPGLAPVTVRNIGRVLSMALEDARRAGHIKANPCRDAKPLPKAKSKGGKTRAAMRALSVEQSKALRQGFGKHGLGLLVTLALATGARRGELLALRWKDINAGTLHIRRTVSQVGADVFFQPPKTEESERAIEIDGATIALLRAERARQAEIQMALGDRRPKLRLDDHLVFHPDPGEPARPYSPDWISLRFARKARQLGFPISLHDLRHTHASQLLAAGVPPTAVAERLGHASVRITLETYAHVLKEASDRAGRAAAEIMRTVLSDAPGL